MSPQYGELSQLTAEICWRVWGTPGNFNVFHVLALLLYRRRSTDVNQSLQFAQCWAIICAAILYIRFRGLLPPNGILPAVKFTLRLNLAFFYIGSITARHSSTER